MSLDVQSISLDISKQPTPQQVRLGQGDANATQLVVSIFDDGETYSLDDYTVRLSLRLPNDGGYYNVNGAKSGNVATFDIDEQYAASVSGFDGFGYVDIMDGETVICSTSRFQLVVLQNASDGVELAPQYIDAVQDAIDRANAAAEAAEGVILQAVPTMSATVKGGALLGDGLAVEDEVLSLDLPTMSASTKGCAKLGSGLSVANDTLSLSGESFTSAEKTKLAGIEDGANNYTLPTMDSSTKGGAKLGAGLSVADDVLSVDASSIATGALPVAHGGTGATDASGARTNLGAMRQPTGFDTANQVNLLNYSASNMYEVPAGGGVVLVECNYRASAWSRVYIFTGNTNTYAQMSTPSEGSGGNQAQLVQVFAGQRLYGERNSSVPYGSVAFLPYTY